MSKPITEPSTGRAVATNRWGIDQLYRRPGRTFPDSCYDATLTNADSDATTNYSDYLSFVVPANDMMLGDVVELTLACGITNTAGFKTYLVQQIQWGANTVSVYPTDHFTPWANGTIGEAFLYRLLFMCVGASDIWMSDLRSKDGPYSMGLGTDAPPTGGVLFNALAIGTADLTIDQTVTLRARWTKDPSFNPAGTGAQLAPVTAMVRRFGCLNIVQPFP